MKIENFFAFYAFEVLMIIDVAVIPAHVARTFDNRGRADFGKRQKRAVHRIQDMPGNKRLTCPRTISADGCSLDSISVL